MTAEDKVKPGPESKKERERRRNPAERLLDDLAALERVVQKDIEESLSFRKANASFDARDETTQLLLAVCERLATEKAAMEQASFAEHSSDLSYLCQHYGTALDGGLSDMAYRDRLQSVRMNGRAGGDPTECRRRGRRFFALCCQSEFPPEQTWWLDVRKRLVPRFHALRANKLVPTFATEIVTGDVVYLAAGQKAPADGRVLVAIEGTTADVSHLTQRAADAIRPCSTQATGLTPAESSNIILKDSHLVTGAAFVLVVRGPRNPFLSVGGPPPGGGDVAAGTAAAPVLHEDCAVDKGVPPGMTLSACQTLFKTLCTKAHLFCRSFWALSQLTESKTLVVLVTEELLSKGTVPKFVTAAQKFGKAFVLVNCNCRKSDLESLGKQLGLDCVEFAADGDGDGEAPSLEGCPTKAEETDTVVGWSGPRSLGEEEKAKLATLARELGSAGSPKRPGVILTCISQAGLLFLCDNVQIVDRPLVYAVSDFHFPRCFSLLVLAGRSDAGIDRYASTPVAPAPPRASVNLEQGCSTPQSSRVVSSPRPPEANAASSGSVSPAVNKTPNPNPTRNPSLVHSSDGSDHPIFEPPIMTSMASLNSLRTVDPASVLNVSQPRRRSLLKDQTAMPSTTELVVSLNSIGVVSEHSDCVLLQSDLGLLGQALEIVCK